MDDTARSTRGRAPSSAQQGEIGTRGRMSPEQLLRAYFRAKDENRPHLLVDVFAADARLEVLDRSGQIGFPGVTIGREGIADVLVRRFNQSYENIYSYYLARPHPTATVFACDWLVGMTEKATRNVRVGCGRYDWTFRGDPVLSVSRLVIHIEQMLSLAPACANEVIGSMLRMNYPWTSADEVKRALSLDGLDPIRAYVAGDAGSPTRPPSPRHT